MLCFVLNKYLKIFLKFREKRSELKSIFQVGQVFEDSGSAFLPWLAEKGQHWQVGQRVSGGRLALACGGGISVAAELSLPPDDKKQAWPPGHSWQVDRWVPWQSRGTSSLCGPLLHVSRVGSYAPSFVRRTRCKGRGTGQSPLETGHKLPLPCGQL